MTAPAQPEQPTAPAPEGAAPPAEPATPPAPPAPPAPSPAQMPQQTTPDDADGDDQDGGDGGGDSAARRARREAKNLRDRLHAQEQAREALAQQVADLTAKQAEADAMRQSWEKLAAVFNPEAAEEPVDPAKLAEQYAAEKAAAEQAAAAALADRDSQIRALAVERAAERAARTAGVDVDALLDSRSFLTAAAKLDPSADTFAADLESAVRGAAEANPKLKVAPVATRSGAEIPGRSGADGQLTLEQVQELAKKDPAALVEAQKKGLLRNIGVR